MYHAVQKVTAVLTKPRYFPPSTQIYFSILLHLTIIRSGFYVVSVVTAFQYLQIRELSELVLQPAHALTRTIQAILT